MSSERAPLMVALLALPESTPASLYGLHEVLGAAGTAWSQVTGEPEVAQRQFRPRIVSAAGRHFVAPNGAGIAVEAPLAAVAAADVVIVTDLAVDFRNDPRGAWPVEAAWVRGRYAAGALVASVCTGSVFLAAAGLLGGLPATTHWAATGLFRDHFPTVRLEPARLLCPAGPDQRIVTGGGASAWSDLALYLIARFAGAAEARRQARLFLLGDHGEGQLPFAAMARPRQHDDGAVAAAQLWIADHYATLAPVARMAARAGLPERSFARRFRKATGYRPVAYVQALRIEEAKQLLETTDAPTEAVAEAVGYADAASFRRLFTREVGVSPARYRQRLAPLGHR